MLAALFRLLQKLFDRSRKRRTHYGHCSRTTATGKLRASAGSGTGAERGSGPDYEIFKVSGLSKSAKKVYIYLSAIADAKGRCFPVYRTIAKRTGLSTSTVGKAIKELEQGGLLSHRQRVSRRGGSSNVYQVYPVSKD